MFAHIFAHYAAETEYSRADNRVYRLDNPAQKAHRSLFIAMNNAIHHDE